MRFWPLLLVGCELVPAPPPPPVVVRDAVASDAGMDAAPVADAAAIAVTADCKLTATHIAEVLISSQADASLKASYETARDRIVQATAEACTTQHWVKDALSCFAEAKVEADLHACEKKFPPAR